MSPIQYPLFPGQHSLIFEIAQGGWRSVEREKKNEQEGWYMGPVAVFDRWVLLLCVCRLNGFGILARSISDIEKVPSECLSFSLACLT